MIRNPRKKVQKRPLKKSSYLVQLFLLTIIPLTALVLIIAFGSISLHHQAMRSLVGDRDLRTVRASANSLGQQLQHRAATIQLLAQGIKDWTNGQSTLTAETNVLTVFDGGVGLFGLDGKLIAASIGSTGWQSQSVLIKDIFGNLAPEKDATFSNLLTQDNGKPDLVLVGARTQDDHILVGAFYPSTLIQVGLSGSVNPDHSTVLVVSAQKQILYQLGTFPDAPDVFNHPGVQEALNGESGIRYYQTSQGEHVVAFSPVPELNWGLILEEPWEKIASPYLRTTQIAPLVLVPVLLLAILALWFGVRQIVRPLQSLEGLAAKVAEGNIEAIQRPVGGISEIRHLQSELKVMTGKLVAAQDSLHDYIGVITDGRENEKQIIARELHDETLQRLIVLNQRIQLSLLQTSEKTEVKALKELNKLTEQAMTDLRQMIRGLRPISLEDFGLSSALEMLVNESSEKGSVTIKFEMSGSEKKLQPEWELALYRITQEALSNIQRHSRAHQGWLILNYSDHNVQLKIRDDGVGFNVPSSQAELSKRGHYGLLGIQERVDLINARLDLESSRGHGTTLTIFLTIK